MVINGQTEFIGSDWQKARKYLAYYLNAPAAYNIDLNADVRNAEDIRVHFQSPGVNTQAVMNFAFVENSVESKVTSGENDGKPKLTGISAALHHD